MRTVVGSCVLCFMAVMTAPACSSTDDRPKTLDFVPTTAGGGGTASDAGPGARDAAADTAADGGDCVPGTYDLDVASTQGGALGIAGTIDLGQTVIAGKRFELAVGGQNAGTLETFPLLAAAPLNTVRYRVRGLQPGAYILRAQADVAATTVVGETGDLDGYYNGSAAGPILLRADATAVRLDASCVGSVSFGIGVRP